MSDNKENEIADMNEIDIAAAMVQEFAKDGSETITIGAEVIETTEAFIPVEQALPTELEDAQVKSIIESILFAAIHPISFAQIKGVFHGVDLSSDRLHDIVNQ